MENKIVQHKITTNLWFDRNAAEAVAFYLSVFKNAKAGRTTRYGKAGYEFHQMPEGTLMTAEFEIEGRSFVALNGGPMFRFNEAVSFIINCASQEEVDYYWERLTEGGPAEAQVCGWLKDKFGVSWQVVPAVLTDMLQDADPAKAGRVAAALMQMKKLDIAGLQAAYDQG